MEDKKKYIIEFAEDPTKCYLVLIKNGNDGLPFMKKKTVRPYKEPDIEAIRKEEHDKGFKEGMDFSLGKAAQEEYYQRGVKKGKAEGMEELWECMKKVNRMPADVITELFGESFSSIDTLLSCMTPANIVEKLNAYERQHKVKAGDGLINAWGTKGIALEVIPQDDGSTTYTVWWKDKEHGRLKKSDWPDRDCRKTGEYFPEVAELLRKMNEDKE